MLEQMPVFAVVEGEFLLCVKGTVTQLSLQAA
jgi:hypothetical protein